MSMKKVINKRVPNCLRKYRRIRGFSQKDVAKRLGLKNSSMISRWECGKCMPNTKNVFRLSVLYHTLVDALFIDIIRSMRAELHQKEKEIIKERIK